MYLDYFDKFKNQEPYLHIDEKEWTYIKDTFEKDDVKETRDDDFYNQRIELEYPVNDEPCK